MKPQTVNRWVNREADSLLRSIGRYTRFVTISKLMLLSLSVFLVVTVIILPAINANQAGLRIAFSNVSDKGDSLPMMTNPKFQGVDSKNQPYTITADAALQHDENIIILENIQADIFLDDASWLALSSNQGMLDREKETLLLSGSVHLYHDKGYQFESEEAKIDMEANMASGTKPVDGIGPMGSLRADSYEIYDRGDRMVFTGNVKLILQPGDKSGDA